MLVGASAAFAQPADIVIRNASVYTMDDRRPRADFIAISGTRVTGVGTERDAVKWIGPTTRVIDARGRVIIPGFNDSHVHFTALGNKFSHLDLGSARSGADVLERVGYFTRFLPPGRWLIGARLDPVGAHFDLPSLSDLDRVSPANPVFLYQADTSRALVNTRALRASGLHDSSSSGVIRGIMGSPSGEVYGPAALRIRKSVPSQEAHDWSAMAQMASNYAASLGVTSVQDVHSDDLYDTLRELAGSGRLKTRVYDCIGLGDWEKRRGNYNIRRASGDAMVRRGCVKGMANGDAEEIADLRNAVRQADAAGLQVMIHAIGEKACRVAVEALDNGSPHSDRRHRIEHARFIASKDIVKAARCRTILSMQPALFYSDGRGAGDDFAGIMRSGVFLAFGSDASMIDIDPMLGIHAAVNNGSGSISVHDAVKAYTLGSARAEFQESEKGSLIVGKLADLTMISRDIFHADKRYIRGTKVLMTMVGGRIVFDAAG